MIRKRGAPGPGGGISMVGFDLAEAPPAYLPLYVFDVPDEIKQALSAVYGDGLPLGESRPHSSMEILQIFMSGWPEGAHLWLAQTFNEWALDLVGSLELPDQLRDMLQFAELPETLAEAEVRSGRWSDALDDHLETLPIGDPLISWVALLAASHGLWSHREGEDWQTFALGGFRALPTLDMDPMKAVVGLTVLFGARAGFAGYSVPGLA